MNPHASHATTDSVARPAIVSVHATTSRSEEARAHPHFHFRPPELPNPRHIHSELPFTAHLGPRLRARP